MLQQRLQSCRWKGRGVAAEVSVRFVVIIVAVMLNAAPALSAPKLAPLPLEVAEIAPNFIATPGRKGLRPGSSVTTVKRAASIP